MLGRFAHRDLPWARAAKTTDGVFDYDKLDKELALSCLLRFDGLDGHACVNEAAQGLGSSCLRDWFPEAGMSSTCGIVRRSYVCYQFPTTVAAATTAGFPNFWSLERHQQERDEVRSPWFIAPSILPQWVFRRFIGL